MQTEGNLSMQEFFCITLYISLSRVRPLLFRWTSSSKLNANLHFWIVGGNEARALMVWNGMGWRCGVWWRPPLSAASWHLAPNDVEGHCGKWRLSTREGEVSQCLFGIILCPQTPPPSSALLCLTIHIQGRAKKTTLSSSVTNVPSGLIGCASAALG